MRGGRARLVWTTNFDPLIADGCAKVYGGTGQLTTVAIETGEIGRHVIDEGRWPVEVKLHGDFRSRRLKNIGDEPREQFFRPLRVMKFAPAQPASFESIPKQNRVHLPSELVDAPETAVWNLFARCV
jgi:hypothetical protein